MRFLPEYLKQRRSVFAACAAFCLIFGLSFFLYHLPIAALAYPALLCTLLAIFLLAQDMHRVYRHHTELQNLASLPENPEVFLPRPRTMEEADYIRIISCMCALQRKQASEARTRHARQADTTAIWAHQIKTPIAAMRLQLQNEDTPQSRELLLELGRIERYVEMLLVCQRLASDSTDYLFRECDLDRLIRASLRRFSGEFIARKLRLDYSNVSFRVVTDEKWLGFVLEQLLSNALKYTPSGGISIYTEGEATLCIRDTGIGIAPEDLPRIFENGYTGLNGRVDARASGLGLYLCKCICDRLGHGIRAESTPGVGTVIYIDLCQSKPEVE